MTVATLPLVERLAPAPDPEWVCERLLDLPYVTWLDSGRDRGALGRFSYLCADPVRVVRHADDRVEEWTADGTGWTPRPGTALDAVRAELDRFAAPRVEGLPAFQGGWAGFFGYGFGRTFERIPGARFDDLALPDLTLGFFDWVIAWDHAAGEAWLISTGLPAFGADREWQARRRRDEVMARLAGPARTPRPHAGFRTASATGRAPSYPVLGIEGAEETRLRSTFTHRRYLDAVERVREYIRAGDIFQANLSQRFQAPLAEPPFELYRRLRRTNPAPFSAWLDYDGVQVLSASPERFLLLEDGRIETRPIKGTIGRGLGPMHDLALGRVLLESEKDRAENVMIVDLLRNDLSRVCAPGSVRVPALCALERHPTVHHLVSTVVGELAPGRDACDLLQATFPGGSITGAPKVRAMEIIAELEPTERGVYCGAIGWLGLDGSMDTSIVIRTFIVRDGMAHFQAGGGIVLDSQPEAEYRETVEKARGLLRALAGGV